MYNVKKSSNKNKLEETVLVGGCFDIIHYGHIVFLSETKKHALKLIIALESDTNVRRMKGPNRPIHTQEQRKKMLESLIFVDKVISLPTMIKNDDYKNFVSKIKPDVIAITMGDPQAKNKRLYAKSIDAKVVVIRKVRTPSTSQLSRLLGLD